MATLYKTRQYRGIDIKIYYDSCADTPRDFEHLTTIWSNSNSYRPDGNSIDNLLYELDLERFPGSFKNLCDIADKRGYFAIPVYAHIHSGIALSVKPFSDHWDSGIFGVVTIPKEKIYKNYNCKRINKSLKQKLTDGINAELKKYADYCNDDVFCFSISSDDYEDTCHGFYGDDFDSNGLMSYAKESIDSYIEQKDRQAVEFWSEIDKDNAA